MRKLKREKHCVSLNRLESKLALCLALLLLSAISSYGVTTNLVPDPKFGSIPVDITGSAVGTSMLGDWKYVNDSGAGGGLFVVTPTHDNSGKAVKLTGNVTLEAADTIPAVAEHTYCLTFWARSDDSDQQLQGVVAAFDKNGTAISNAADSVPCSLTSDWKVFCAEVTVPTDTAGILPQFKLTTSASAEICDVCLIDKASDINMLTDGSLDTVTDVGSSGTTPVGQWRYINTSSLGTLHLVTPGRDGTGQAVEITSADSGMSVGIDRSNHKITVIPGHRYCFSWWMRGTGTTNVEAIVCANLADGTWVNSSDRVTPPTDNWAKFTEEFIAPDNCINVNPELYVKSQTVQIDDVAFVDVTNMVGNLMPNGGFEDLDDNGSWADKASSGYRVCTWRFCPGSSTTTTPSAMQVVAGRDGSGKALKLIRNVTGSNTDCKLQLYYADSGKWNGFIPATAGHKYRMTFWMRTDDASCPTIYSYLSVMTTALNSSNQMTYSSTSINQNNRSISSGITSKWTQFVEEITATDGTAGPCADLQPQFQLRTAGSVEIDDVVVEDVTMSGSISGTVRDRLLNTPIEGATVAAQSVLAAENLLLNGNMDSCISGATWVPADGGSASATNWTLSTSGGAGGSAAVISPGYNSSDNAIQITRTAADGDTALSQNAGLMAPIAAGHTYRLSAWVRSDDTSPAGLALQLAAYDGSSNLIDTVQVNYTPTNSWSFCSGDVVVPAGTSTANFSVRYLGAGSVVVDNLSVKDVTFNYATATDSAGAYVLNIIPGVYSFSVAANGYSSYSSLIGNDAYALTNDVVLSSTKDQSWSIYDNFERDDNTDLGTTEDSSAFPWMKSTDCAVINDKTLYMTNLGVSQNYANIGRDFEPADLDISVTMNWIDQTYSAFAGIVYRQSSLADMNNGYAVLVYRWMDPAKISLQYNGTELASYDISSIANYTGDVIKVSVSGTEHKVWYNDTLAIDYVDNQKTTGGYFGLTCDNSNEVRWDNFKASHTSAVTPDVTGAISDVKLAADGTVVEVKGAAVSGVYKGFFYAEDISRSSGIKVVSDMSVNVGNAVDVIGTIATDSNNERYISASTVTADTSLSMEVLPLGMNNKAFMESLATGLLVRTWGTVKSVDSSFIKIEDGSGVTFGVLLNDLVTPLTKTVGVGDYIAVTGAAGYENYNSTIYRVIRPRGDSDIN